MRSARFATLLCAVAILLHGCGYLGRQATIAYLEVTSHLASKEIEIEIHRSFMERYANRVTIDASFTVDKAAPVPNPAFIDGDLHFSGRAPQVGFATVGEIVNAASQKAAVDLVHRVAGRATPIHVSGAWRVWPEHAGGRDEEQGQRDEPVGSANPNHVFEIHPVTRIESLSLLESFVPVKGFKPGEAGKVFEIYEKARCTLRVKPRSISIVTTPGLYNDVEFVMEIAGTPQHVVRDGRFVTASVYDTDGHLVADTRRMVFVKGTPPERAVKGLGRGDRLHVYGIPRVDFAEVLRRAHRYHSDPELLTRSLPYEIIVIGVFEPAR